MFAKILSRTDRLRYIMNVKDIDAEEVDTHFTESLINAGYSNVPEGANEVRGRCMSIVSSDEDEGNVLVFCNNVVYLCSETGQTVDRINCGGN